MKALIVYLWIMAAILIFIVKVIAPTLAYEKSILNSLNSRMDEITQLIEKLN